jgi:hypothetical protein
VVDSAPIKSLETIELLIGFKWGIIGGLCISQFEHIKGESRSTSSVACTKNNAGLAAVIKRLQNILVSLLAIAYKGVFHEFTNFITEDDRVDNMGGDQIVFNFDSAMAKVGNSVMSGIPMKLGDDGAHYSTKGAREVAKSIIAAMGYQVEQMKNRDFMRNQGEDFKRIISRQIARSQGTSSYAKSTPRDFKTDDGTVPEAIIKQPFEGSDRKAGGKGNAPKGGKKGGDKGDNKTGLKSKYLCVAFLGESLGAHNVDNGTWVCHKGDACFYQHKKATSITRAEADEAMRKPAESDMKTAILKKISTFKHFKK